MPSFALRRALGTAVAALLVTTGAVMSSPHAGKAGASPVVLVVYSDYV